MKTKAFFLGLFFLIFFIFPEFCGAQTITAQTTGTVGTFQNNAKVDDLTRRRPVVNTSSNKIKLTTAEISRLEHRTFDLINQKRRDIGLSALEWSEDVAKIARMHSEDMAKFNYFSHAGLDGKMVDDRADSIGLSKWRAIGENIAFNRGYDNPVECAVENWMQSAGHRQNLLNDRWKESGIGIAVGADGSFFLTQVFLVRK